MRTTLDLPDPLFRELKVQSAKRGIKLKDFVARLIASGLTQEQADDPKPRARSPLPTIRRATGVTHPYRSNREIETLLAAEDAGD